MMFSVAFDRTKGTSVNVLYRLLASERGANILEYTVMISLIALVAMFAIALVGKATTANITPVLDHL
jgi:Flp pilus assembly pilin Flp